MTPDSVDPAGTQRVALGQAAHSTLAESAGELAVPLDRGLRSFGSRGAALGWWARLREDPERMRALKVSARALVGSRLLIWAAVMSTIAAFGFGPVRTALNPPGMTRGFGWLGNLLAAPAARWDAAWYLVIAHFGYRPDLGAMTASRTAFFPLYPLGLRGISWLGVPPVIAGVLLSLIALAFALYGIHRLSMLELGAGRRSALTAERLPDGARLAVLLTAFAPMAFYFSAVYSESLYLALSVGVFWSARTGRWAWVGILGALAAATRSTGVLLLLPAAMIYLYGPREDLPADLLRRARSRARLLPRYRLRPDALWLALVPGGVLAYCLYLGLSGGDLLSPLHAQGAWGRHFAGPYLGLWDGAKAAFEGARQLLSFQRRHLYFPAGEGSPSVSAGHNLMLFAFALIAIPAVIGVTRRLPLAYLAYILAALVVPLSEPVRSQPLMSLPRFLVVLFPLFMWLGAWLAERPRVQRPALVLSALLMMFFAAQFATWHWVA
jgi:hypothetical protein